MPQGGDTDKIHPATFGTNSHGVSCPKDSSVPGCDAVFRGEELTTFRKFVVPSPTRVTTSWSAFSEDEGTTTFRNVRYHLI